MQNNLKQMLGKIASDLSTNTSAESSPDSQAEQDYNCERCDNWRWVPVGNVADGKMAPCECQAVAWNATNERRLQQYSLLPEGMRRSFADTVPDGSTEGVDPASFRKAFDAARNFAKTPGGWLLLKGPVGTGKTHLALAIVQHCIEAGTPARFENVATLMDELRRGAADRQSAEYAERLEQAITAPLLVLDDIAGARTEWSAERLEHIIERRFSLRLPTVITWDTDTAFSNERIERRLQDLHMVSACQINSNAFGGQHARDLSVEMLKRMTFEAFNEKGRGKLSATSRGVLKRAKESAMEFANEPDGWLYINGRTGAGKTHLAAAIAGARIQKGDKVAFYFVPNLLDTLRHSYERGRQHAKPQDLLKEITSAHLLVLDDLGAGNSTAWAEELLYQIITDRHNHRRPTVITSRGSLLHPDAIDRKSGRVALQDILPSKHIEAIWSRLRDDLVTDVPIDVPDYRAGANGQKQSKN